MKYFLSFVILLFNSCAPTNSNIDTTSSTFQIEVASLDTKEKQKIFLEEIYRMDQKVRTDETAILQEFGNDSKEHQAAWVTINKTDDDNLEKIELFLNRYGHPTLQDHGKKAVGAPWIVIHHTSKKGPRRRNFNYLYGAWKAGDLDGGRLAFYLNRMYARENGGTRMVMKNPFTEDFEIDTLMEVMGLKDSVLME